MIRNEILVVFVKSFDFVLKSLVMHMKEHGKVLKYLKHLTEQAVVLQKRMNDVVKGQLLMIPSITVCCYFVVMRFIKMTN